LISIDLIHPNQWILILWGWFLVFVGCPYLELFDLGLYDLQASKESKAKRPQKNHHNPLARSCMNHHAVHASPNEQRADESMKQKDEQDPIHERSHHNNTILGRNLQAVYKTRAYEIAHGTSKPGGKNLFVPRYKRPSPSLFNRDQNRVRLHPINRTGNK
jgi:hypothetical protein